jgi:hypothetical protein
LVTTISCVAADGDALVGADPPAAGVDELLSLDPPPLHAVTDSAVAVPATSTKLAQRTVFLLRR